MNVPVYASTGRILNYRRVGPVHRNPNYWSTSGKITKFVEFELSATSQFGVK